MLALALANVESPQTALAKLQALANQRLSFGKKEVQWAKLLSNLRIPIKGRISANYWYGGKNPMKLMIMSYFVELWIWALGKCGNGHGRILRKNPLSIVYQMLDMEISQKAHGTIGIFAYRSPLSHQFPEIDFCRKTKRWSFQVYEFLQARFIRFATCSISSSFQSQNQT